MKRSESRNVLATLVILILCALGCSRQSGCSEGLFQPPVYDPRTQILINARPKHPTGLATDALSQKGRKLLKYGCSEETVIKVLGPPLARWQSGKVLVYATAGVSYDWNDGGDWDGKPKRYLTIDLDSEARVYTFAGRSGKDLEIYYPTEKLAQVRSQRAEQKSGQNSKALR
jgi:hypothetical protein